VRGKKEKAGAYKLYFSPRGRGRRYIVAETYCQKEGGERKWSACDGKKERRRGGTIFHRFFEGKKKEDRY